MLAMRLKPFFLNFTGWLAAKRFFRFKPEQFKYSASLDWFVTLDCNLSCAYCTSISNWKIDRTAMGVSSKLVKSLNETDRIFHVIVTGGEPFLSPNLMEILESLTKRHYISINTNLTLPNIEDFSERISPKRVVAVLASFHAFELERRQYLSKYIKNLSILKRKGFNVSVKAVAYPPLLNRVNHYREIFREAKVSMVFTSFRGVYQGRKYPQAYTKEEIEAFSLSDISLFTLPHRGEICNAGYNFAFCWENGDVTPCHRRDMRRIGSLEKGIKFNDDLMVCPYEFCACPRCVYDPYLFNKALREKGMSA